jgi:hypothetical protein
MVDIGSLLAARPRSACGHIDVAPRHRYEEVHLEDKDAIRNKFRNNEMSGKSLGQISHEGVGGHARRDPHGCYIFIFVLLPIDTRIFRK